MTTQYYLRVSGVNLAHSVYDTQDLNTIRGGGLMVLRGAERQVLSEPWPELAAGLNIISIGASVALLEFCVETDQEAAQVREKAAAALARDPKLHEVTFVVDVVRAHDGPFEADRQRLMALNQHQQMTALTLAIPEENQDPECGVCDGDRLRPGPHVERRDGEDLRRSESVFQRRKYGKEQKKGFYTDEIASDLPVEEKRRLVTELVRWDFSHHFEDLTAHPPEAARGLAGKLAVIYFDGNGFGGLLRDVANSPALHSKFFDACQDLRREFLRQLLATMNADEDGWVNTKCQSDDGRATEPRYRFETLLWGGDEMLWVVPAWKGWEVVERFYRFFKAQVFRTCDDSSSEPHPLTFAGGLVFASHKAPIQRLTALARKLADLAKDRMKREAKPEQDAGNAEQAKALRYQNLFAYEVLESFDHTGGMKLDDYRKQRLPQGADLAKLILNGEVMGEIAKAIRGLKEADFPRSALHELARPALRSHQRDTDTILARLKRRRPKLGDPIENLVALTSKDLCWWHLDQLWDYLPLERPTA